MKKTLLLVDDVKINREILKKCLGDEYLILEADNGRDAISVIQQEYHTISAIVLDIVMPVMDGFQVMEKLQSVPELSAIPVIVETAETDEESEMRAMSLGAVDFISKPYNPVLIRKRIDNILKQREAMAEAYAAARDDLTGLLNRKSFFEQVSDIVSTHDAGAYIMACFDVDQFKVINDQYGTKKGDEVLKHIANVFQEGFAPHGGLCCRVSSDNFAVLYPAAFKDSAKVAEIRKRAASVEGLASPIIFSIGRYVVDDLSMTPSAMYDRAMLAAASIKGRYGVEIAQYDESMRGRLLHEQQLVTEMEAALHAGQFELWYQPQYNHSTGALVGAEALVRWRHPQRGLIQPSEFIPVFEQNGFIYALDRYIWTEACRFLKKCLDAGGTPLPVSVNISRYDALQPDIVEYITGQVESWGVPVELLRLEITESAFAEVKAQIISVVKRLVDYGFTLEIDDFGSGYSSLNTLKDVPAQVIKLDMRFLEDGCNSERGGNIVESVVRMTKWLDMSVIAEGVETIEQADFLRSIGCNYMQGYLFARPMPEAEYEALLAGAGREEKLMTMETVENLNNNSFWDPASMDTLIFNSFVGGACIYEYHRGRIELLRATEKYAQVIGSAGMTVEDALKLNWTEHLDAETAARVMADLDASVITRNEVTGEYVFLDLPGCPHETYLRSTMRVIASAGDRYLVYCTNENITAQRKAEQREARSAYQLKTIMDSVNSGISALTFDKNGKGHIVFANDCYYAMFGYTREQAGAETDSVGNFVHPDDLPAVREAMYQLLKDRVPREMEYRCVRRDGSVIHVRGSKSAAHIEDYGGDVIISVITDISEIVSTEQRAEKLAGQLQAIMDNVDLGILATVVRGGDAEVLFANEHYYAMLGYTKAQFEAEIRNMFSTVALEDRQRVRRITADINRLEASTVIAFDALCRDGSRITLRAALSVGRFAGVDEPVQLAIFRDITEEKQLEERESRTAELMQTMMNDMPGGFVRMLKGDDGAIRPVYFNAGMMKLCGMSEDELMALYAGDVMTGVHPDDLPAANEAFARMLEKGEAQSARYRLRRGDGGYVWLSVFGRVTKDASGNTFLNIYYTDATEQVKAEEQQKELLDNLPYGAALYDFDGAQLSIVHLNKRYWELVDRVPTAYEETSILGAIHPDDQGVISRELEAAIRQKRDVVCDIRLRYGKDGYRPFHIVGRVVKKDGGKYAIYAAYTPISDETMSYQQMLPILLSTIMGSTTDLAFAKDKDLRYISASLAFAKMAGCESESDVIGKTDYDLYEKDVADKFRSDDLRLMESGKPIIDMVEPIPSADGIPHYSSTSKYLLRDGNGNLEGIYGVGRDITAYRDAFDQLKLMTDSIPGGIATYECTADSIRLMYCNDGFCRLFGTTREEYEAHAAVDPISWVFAEDLPLLRTQVRAMVEYGTTTDCTYRVHVKGGGYKWIGHKAVPTERRNGRAIIYAMIQDVTEQREMVERLRQSEEENNLAVELGGTIICRFTVADRTLIMAHDAAEVFALPEIITDVPYGPVKQGLISPESVESYTAFFEAIVQGGRSGSAVFQQQYLGEWRWMEAKSATVFSDGGEPVKAVISFQDVTERLEKETVYKKWQQSLAEKNPDSYTLFRCNLSKDASFDTVEGALLNVAFSESKMTFDERTAEYVEQCVCADDKQRYTAFLDADTMLASYYRGKRSDVLEYRELRPDGSLRWLRLTVELVEYPNSTDVEAYLMYEDIDAAKRRELTTKRLAETDPLTGVLNRVSFIEKVGAALSAARPGARSALMMLDIDGFKLVNDVFGHIAGDRALTDIAASMTSILGPRDLVGRLGGDEFMLYLSDIPTENSVATIAGQICAFTRRAFSLEVQISGSIGIAVASRDGTDFDTLYKKADAALYHVKGSGKDGFAFYRDDMSDEHLEPEEDGPDAQKREKLRRMLIVDDDPIDYAVLANVFKNEFIIEKAKDGASALVRLRHYGSGISVVLLDLMMPGMDGFAVLETMQSRAEMQSIPVIIVSGDESRETCLRTIRSGASDFITKPVDPELLRIRVRSAVSKAENERLRAQNRLLEMQTQDKLRYEAALDSTEVSFIEYDWIAGEFHYHPSISKHILGAYDDRMLWRILLSDMVTDTVTVQRMQGLVHDVAQSRTRMSGNMTVQLRTPEKALHRFRMNVRKQVNEYQLTSRLILTLVDLDCDI